MADEPDQRSLLCLDFDHTLVKGHLHAALSQDRKAFVNDAVEQAKQANPNYNDAEVRQKAMDDFRASVPERGAAHIDNMGLKNPEAMRDTIRGALNSGHSVAITSFTDFPEAMPHALKKMGLNEDEIGKIKIYGGPPNDGSYNSAARKEDHIQKAMQGAGITDPGKVILVDDDPKNIAKAKADGHHAFEVPTTHDKDKNHQDANPDYIQGTNAALGKQAPAPAAPTPSAPTPSAPEPAPKGVDPARAQANANTMNQKFPGGDWESQQPRHQNNVVSKPMSYEDAQKFGQQVAQGEGFQGKVSLIKSQQHEGQYRVGVKHDTVEAAAAPAPKGVDPARAQANANTMNQKFPGGDWESQQPRHQNNVVSKPMSYDDAQKFGQQVGQAEGFQGKVSLIQSQQSPGQFRVGVKHDTVEAAATAAPKAATSAPAAVAAAAAPAAPTPRPSAATMGPAPSAAPEPPTPAPSASKPPDVVTQAQTAVANSALPAEVKSDLSDTLSQGIEANAETDPQKKAQKTSGFLNKLKKYGNQEGGSNTDKAKGERKQGLKDDFNDGFKLTDKEGNSTMPKDEGEALADLIFKALMALLTPLKMAANKMGLTGKFEEAQKDLGNMFSSKGSGKKDELVSVSGPQAGFNPAQAFGPAPSPPTSAATSTLSRGADGMQEATKGFMQQALSDPGKATPWVMAAAKSAAGGITMAIGASRLQAGEPSLNGPAGPSSSMTDPLSTQPSFTPASIAKKNEDDATPLKSMTVGAHRAQPGGTKPEPGASKPDDEKKSNTRLGH